MKNHLSSSDEDENVSSRMACFWWRSAAKFDECVKPRLDLPNVSNLTPRLRVLREMERLALIAPEGLNELRHKLLNYSSGDFWVPAGGIKKEEMDIPSIITILLVGFSGSGKSALVNLMYSVLSRSGLLLFAQTSSGSSCSSDATTMYLEEHNVLRSMRSGFCVYDSRGYDYDRVSEGLAELSACMSEGVHHNQPCLRSVDYASMKNNVDVDHMRSSSKFLQRRVNCVMVVADIADIYKALKAGDTERLEATRQLFCAPDLRKCNENPILIFTHGDMLSTEERIDARLKICECLGVSESNGVYDIVCLTEYGIPAEECDPVSAYAVTEAVYRALLVSDRGHLPKKNLRDWAVLILSWLLCFIACVFTFLADICSRIGHRDNKLKF